MKQQLKNKVFNKRCFICKKIYFRLEIHHIDKNRKNNVLKNLLIVCPKCHNKIHNNKFIDSPTFERFIIKKFHSKCNHKVITQNI